MATQPVLIDSEAEHQRRPQDSGDLAVPARLIVIKAGGFVGLRRADRRTPGDDDG